MAKFDPSDYLVTIFSIVIIINIEFKNIEIGDTFLIIMEKVGTSWMIDFDGVDDPRYHNAEFLEDLLIKAAKYAGLHVLTSSSHQFDIQLNKRDEKGGATAFVLLSESHISIHTWPEYSKIAFDLFSCGHNIQGDKVIDYMKQHIVHDGIMVNKTIRGK